MVMPRGGGEQPPRKPQGVQSSSTSSGSKPGGNENLASGDAMRRARAMDNRRSAAGRGQSPPSRGGERLGGRHQPASSPPNQQSSHMQQKQVQRRPSPHTMPSQHSRASPSTSLSPVKTSDPTAVMIKRTIFNAPSKPDRNLTTVQTSAYQRTRSRSPQEHFEQHQQALVPERKSRESVPPSSGYSEYQKRPTVASSTYTERHTFRGPDTPVILDEEKTRKMTFGISNNVAELKTIPQDFVLNRREGEGTQPMFDRPDIKVAIQHRIQREIEEGKLLNMVEKLQATSVVTHAEVSSSLRPGEQRVVAVIREPILVPTEIRPRYRESDRYYEEDERRERERRGDSRDRHYSSRYRDSPPRHYDSRRESERSRDRRSRSRDREREHERDREYYRRHSDSYRDYRDRDRDRERERERERDREREMRDREHRHHRGEHERRRSPRDYRDSHRSYRHSPPPGHHRSEGYPPRPSGEHRSGGFPPPPSAGSKPPGSQQPSNNGAAPSSAPPVNFDPEYVPKGRAYFEHDNRDTFVPMGRGRGGFPPNFHPRGGFMPPRGFMPRGGMRGRGGFPPGPPGPPPFPRGPPPFYGPRGPPRGGFARTKRRSPDWKHDLFEANDQDQRPSSTTK